MGNCLVTKLKGVVNNDNLPIYGVTSIKVKAVADFTPGTTRRAISISPVNNPVTVKCRDGVNHFAISNGSTDYTLSELLISPLESHTLYVENTDFIIDIYGCRYGSISTIALQGDMFYVDANDIVPKQFDESTVSIIVEGEGISGKLSDFSKKTNLTTLRLEHSNIEGDITVIGDLKSLSVLRIGYTKISGSVEDLVSSWLSGSNPKILDSPMSIPGLVQQLSFGAFNYIGGAATSLMYNSTGTKIEVYYDPNNVYIKGYKNDGTDSEYNTNIGSGGKWEDKTVIDADTKQTWHTPA